MKVANKAIFVGEGWGSVEINANDNKKTLYSQFIFIPLFFESGGLFISAV
jgi:hypothetical protein